MISKNSSSAWKDPGCWVACCLVGLWIFSFAALVVTTIQQGSAMAGFGVMVWIYLSLNALGDGQP